jgi:hypothetical protein
MIFKLKIPEKPKKKLCSCGNFDISLMGRVPNPKLIKMLFSWIPLKRYKYFHCLRVNWLLL